MLKSLLVITSLSLEVQIYIINSNSIVQYIKASYHLVTRVDLNQHASGGWESLPRHIVPEHEEKIFESFPSCVL